MVVRNLMAASCIASVLAACGGGGGADNFARQNGTETQDVGAGQSGSNTSSTNLSGSNGDLSKYLGTWKSMCKEVAGSGAISSSGSDTNSSSGAGDGSNGGTSTTYTYSYSTIVFSSVNGTTLMGQSTDSIFKDNRCTVVDPAYSSGPANFTATYQAGIAIPSGTELTGTADQFAFSIQNGPQDMALYFAFEPNYAGFYTSDNGTFSMANVFLTRQ